MRSLTVAVLQAEGVGVGEEGGLMVLLDGALSVGFVEKGGHGVGPCVGGLGVPLGCG